MNLGQFFRRLDELGDHIPLPTLKVLLKDLEISPTEIEDCTTFSAERYQRNRIRLCENYEALFLCFEAGQRTPIHDHAGSACGVKVIEGKGLETIFFRTVEGWIYATGSRELPSSGVVGSNDMDTHQLSNLQSGGKRLVTLHIYSPPLQEVGNYALESNCVTHVHPCANDRLMTFAST